MLQNSLPPQPILLTHWLWLRSRLEWATLFCGLKWVEADATTQPCDFSSLFILCSVSLSPSESLSYFPASQVARM